MGYDLRVFSCCQYIPKLIFFGTDLNWRKQKTCSTFLDRYFNQNVTHDFCLPQCKSFQIKTFQNILTEFKCYLLFAFIFNFDSTFWKCMSKRVYQNHFELWTMVIFVTEFSQLLKSNNLRGVSNLTFLPVNLRGGVRFSKGKP